MTSVVGIKCKDGIAIGTDSSTTLTSGELATIEQRSQKIDIISAHIILAGTGYVGHGQRFGAILGKVWDENKFRGSPVAVGTLLAKETIEDFGSTKVEKGSYGALVGFPCDNKAYLCEFAVAHFQPELKTDSLWFCSMGSAQPITDPFLAFLRDIFWPTSQPSVTEGTFAVTWTLDHAIQFNPGGVNGPPQIGILERGKNGHLGARLLSDNELFEHRQNIEEAKKAMREFKNRQAPSDQQQAPSIPKPPP